MLRFRTCSATAGAAILLLVVRAATAVAGDGPDAGHSWSTYANGRFDYSLCYPDDVLRPQPEAQNGDGRSFQATDGAELLVYGLNNVLGQSVRAAFAAAASDHARGAGRVTYSVVRPDWFVVSGESEGRIFYVKTLYNRRDDAFKTFEFTYAAADRPLYDPIVGRIAGCFRDEAR